jgi:hypothetical protein
MKYINTFVSYEGLYNLQFNAVCGICDTMKDKTDIISTFEYKIR